jgi:hypothetical protein
MLCLIGEIIFDETSSVSFLPDTSAEHPRECINFYFDFGTNVGIQIRKVFEPELYPGASILPYFDMYFGQPSERQIPGTVCAIGVEPNVAHEERLKLLEKSYNERNWFTRIYTISGVGTSSGWMLLKSDGDLANQEWGAQLIGTGNEVNSSTPGAVRILDAVEILREFLDMNGPTPFNRKVIVKVDIEGMDTQVINYMKTSGILCQVDFVYVEHMPVNDINSLNYDLFEKECPTSVMYIDDELYHNSDFPLPVPLIT